MSYKSCVFAFLIFAVYLTCVWCEETDVTEADKSETELVEGRRRHHGLHRLWGIYGLPALAVFYWLKVKAVIAAFLVGSAIVWGFKYYKSHHDHGCEVIQESPFISYDHGPAWSSGPHDHIPYSLDHNPYEHDHSHEHESFSGSDIVSDSFPGNEPYSPPSGGFTATAPTAPATGPASRRRRGRQLESEEQVSEIMFAFLGITNDACRRRFICEMEFRAKESPFTRMAFGIVGRGIFSKYVNNKNENGHASSFRECARVNPECSLIEENINNNNDEEAANDSENEARSFNAEPRDLEKENEANLKAEIESSQQSSTPVVSADPIAKAIFSRSQVEN